MTNRRMWSRKTADESGPLYEFHIDGEGDGRGVGEKTPPRAQDSLKSASPEPASDPAFAKAASRWQVRPGIGGPDPYAAPRNDGVQSPLDAEWENFDLENERRLETLGIDPQGEFSNEDLDRAGVPRFEDAQLAEAAASLRGAGITDLTRLNPDFLQSEFGLSREQAFALMSGLLETPPEAEDWLTPEEIEQRGF